MNNPFKGRVRLRSAQGERLINMAELVWLEAHGSYTKYHLLKDGAISTYLQSGNLGLHINKLDDAFLRISNSAVVNLEFVEMIRSDRKVDLTVPVETPLVVSRAYWRLIQPLL